MKKIVLALSFITGFSLGANAQFDQLNKERPDAAEKTTQEILTLYDGDIDWYSREYMEWMDSRNVLCKTTDENTKSKEYADRLEKIKADIIMPEGLDIEILLYERLDLDIQVYDVADQHIFGCPHGSIRLMAGLMDMLTDDEILGVIGHEIGHLAHSDTQYAFKKALSTPALEGAVGSTHLPVAKLTDPKLGVLGEALANAQFSQEEEYAADDYGYELLKQRGKDAGAMASALRKIQQLQDDSNLDRSKVKQLFPTHPESGKRAERLEKKG